MGTDRMMRGYTGCITIDNLAILGYVLDRKKHGWLITILGDGEAVGDCERRNSQAHIGSLHRCPVTISWLINGGVRLPFNTS